MRNLLDANRPVAWQNQPLRLFHGTDEVSAASILSSGVELERGRRNTDFGRGFYCTSLEGQATNWALEKAFRNKRLTPVVLTLQVSREEIAALDALTFVAGSAADEDFWSLVWHCREGGRNHRRATTSSAMNASYDLVAGPVASNWRQRMLASGADQYGFHTETAVALLNRAVKEVTQL